jgi:hypothetical protein
VFGASVLLAEGASQKPLNGIRTRGSQGPDDSQGHVDHMEHLGCAFKVNSVWVAGEVKEIGQPDHRAAPVRNSNDQNSCKKFSQIAMFAQKIDSLPPKHTFPQSKK